MGAVGGWTAEQVRSFLIGESPILEKQRRRHRRIPSDPRCKLCAAPFGGIGGPLFRAAGYRRSSNPAMCDKCNIVLRQLGLSGVEIPVALIFSDVRGSTAMAERLRPTEFHDFLDRFYRLATQAIVGHDGLVDKIVGDEVIGLFFGAISGPNPAAAAVAAAVELAERAALDDVPVGTAVHAGDAFVGETGIRGTVEGFTALGDTVNTTARLAAVAGPGEVMVSVAAAEAAGAEAGGLERRTAAIRGRTEPIEVVVLAPQRRTDEAT